MQRASVTDAVGRLGTEGAFAVLARARALEAEGRDVIHLEIGEPDFETPAHVAEAGIAAIRAGETHYCQTAGLPVLREAAAASLAASRGVAVDPRHVLVANGAKPFLFFTVLATCGPGDEVIYPDPGFPIYESAVRFAGATPVPLPLREERGFSFDPGGARELLSERTRLVILNAPQNPTGGVIPPADLERAAAAIVRTPAWVLTDEVYSRITYDVEAPSIASLPGMLERTILLDGFSKTFSMTGLAAGLRRRAGRSRRPADPPDRQLDVVRAAVRPARRRRGSRGAAGRGRRDGGRVPPPSRLSRPGAERDPGARASSRVARSTRSRTSRLPIDADTLAERLLVEAGVALLAGSAFGIHATDHLRISYASSLENLEHAVERIRAFVAALWTPSRRAMSELRGFVDVHSHVVPSGDDGARAIEDGLALCRLAFEAGTRSAVRDAARSRAVGPFPRTPERDAPTRRSPVMREEVAAGGSTFGAAGRCTRPRSPARRPTSSRSRGRAAVLIEFPGFWLDLDDAIAIVTEAAAEVEAAGLVPVLAHPERCRAVAEDPGCVVRSSSVAGCSASTPRRSSGGTAPSPRAHGVGAARRGRRRARSLGRAPGLPSAGARRRLRGRPGQARARR